MRYYLKQHLFTWGDRFSIYDSSGNAVYSVEGDVFTLGKKLHIFDSLEREVAMIKQHVFAILPRYEILEKDEVVASIETRLSFLRDRYHVTSLDWEVEGDFLNRNYTIAHGEETIATVFREWFTLGDAYAIEISPQINPVYAISVALVIDAVISDQRN